MVHKCALCGNISFTTFHAYEAHRLEYHNIHKAIKPENVTGRSHAQIVDEAERTWLEPHLLKLDKPIAIVPTTAHSEDCNCAVCFNVKLDRLLESSQKALDEVSNPVKLNQDINYID